MPKCLYCVGEHIKCSSKLSKHALLMKVGQCLEPCCRQYTSVMLNPVVSRLRRMFYGSSRRRFSESWQSQDIARYRKISQASAALLIRLYGSPESTWPLLFFSRCRDITSNKSPPWLGKARNVQQQNSSTKSQRSRCRAFAEFQHQRNHLAAVIVE